MDKEKTLRKLRQELEDVKKKFGVEFAEVVRCGECKHWNEGALACNLLPWVSSSEHENWYAEDFCSYGERRYNKERG